MPYHSPTFPGGGREDALVAGPSGGVTVEVEDPTVGPDRDSTNWRIHSCCSGVNGGSSAGPRVGGWRQFSAH